MQIVWSYNDNAATKQIFCTSVECILCLDTFNNIVILHSSNLGSIYHSYAKLHFTHLNAYNIDVAYTAKWEVITC